MKVIIDTDPGQDDAAAIMLALGSPEIELLGLTVVAGNVPLDLTVRNARIVCEIAGRTDVRVYAGAAMPLVGVGATAEHVHGASGLDGPELFEPTMPVQVQGAVDFLVETLRAEPAGTVTLCPIGPLTNIALALKQAPEIARRIERIVLMGGGYFAQGNITPSAEFNIYVDPEAAAIVLASGAPIVMAPLDVTHKALATERRIAPLRQIGNRSAKALVDMLTYYERFNRAKYGVEGAPLHDPLTVAWLLRPDLFSGRTCNVEVETGSTLTRGATVVDWWGVTDRPKNALVLGDVDADAVFALLAERVANLA